MVCAFSKQMSTKLFICAGVVSAAMAAPAQAQIQFEEKTATSGIAFSGETWGAAWGDVDGDGRPDIHTNNHRTEDSVWLNKGNGTFEDVARQIDIDGTWRAEATSDTHGATWADFDNDGDQDLMVSSGQNGNNNFGDKPYGFGWRFFINQGGLLDDQTLEKGFTITSLSGGRFPGWIDANNDGRLDLMALAQDTGRDAHLYIQNSNGSFTNTTNTRQRCRSNHFMLLSDLDVNGRMELICVGKNDFPDKVYSTHTTPFTDRTSTVPFTTLVQDTAIADFNNDLRPDIFHVRGGKRISGAHQGGTSSVESQMVADGTDELGMSFQTTGTLTVNAGHEGQKSTSRVYIGSGGYHPATYSFTLNPATSANWGIKPHLTSSSTQRGIYIGYTPATNTWQVLTSPGNTWTLTNFEIYSTSPITGLTFTGDQALDRPIKPSLFLNLPGGFQEADSKIAGLNEAILCVDVVPGDFDNDADVDLYVVCRDASKNIPNRLYENLGNATFAVVEQAGGAEGALGLAIIDGAGTGETAVTADYDSDGFLDLFVTNGLNEMKSREGGPNQLFRNRANGNKWIEIDLQGVTSNRDGLGAKVFATTPNGLVQLREQNGGYHRWAQNHKRIHFGLANQTSANIRVEWPSGQVSNFTGVAANSIYRIVENGTITPVIIVPPPPSACGAPVYDKAVDRAIFLWKDCSTGQWRMVMTSGGSTLSTSGSVVASQPIGAVAGVSIEASDVLDTSNPNQIIYSLVSAGAAQDGFNFTPASDAAVCFGSGAPAGTQVLVGSGRVPMTAPFNLATFAPCS